MFGINSLLTTLVLAVCCVHLVSSAAIPSPSSSRNSTKHRELINSLAKARNVKPEEMEEIGSFLATYRQNLQRKQEAKAERQANGTEYKAMRDRIARRRKAYANLNQTRTIPDVGINEHENVSAEALEFMIEGDIIVSLEEAKLLASGKPLSVVGEEMPEWWHKMGSKRNGNRRLTKSETGELISQLHASSNDTKAIQKRQALNPSATPSKLWPTTSTSSYPYIPYAVDSTVSSNTKALIKRAVKYWNDFTCIYFREDTVTTPRLLYRSLTDGICNSGVGRQSATATTQNVNIAKTNCESVSTIVHESGHAAGFNHEQSRLDRDDWIEVKLNNVEFTPLNKRPNYDIKDATENNNFGIPYDFGSVMHYTSTTFGIKDSNGVKAQTMVSLPGNTLGNGGSVSWEWDQVLGSGGIAGPSMMDYKVMNKLYNCDTFCTDTPKTCYRGGFQNPNDCNCVCPPGIGGDTCLTPLATDEITGYAPASIENLCDGSSTTSTTTWETLERTIGQEDWAGELNNDVAYCHWYLKVASGYHIEIEVQASNGWSGTGCGAGFTEVRVSDSISSPDYSKTGRRFCRQADLQAQGGPTLNVQSVGTTAYISTYVVKGDRYFKLRHRAVANSG